MTSRRIGSGIWSFKESKEARAARIDAAYGEASKMLDINLMEKTIMATDEARKQTSEAIIAQFSDVLDNVIGIGYDATELKLYCPSKEIGETKDGSKTYGMGDIYTITLIMTKDDDE